MEVLLVLQNWETKIRFRFMEGTQRTLFEENKCKGEES